MLIFVSHSTWFAQKSLCSFFSPQWHKNILSNVIISLYELKLLNTLKFFTWPRSMNPITTMSFLQSKFTISATHPTSPNKFSVGCGHKTKQLTTSNRPQNSLQFHSRRKYLQPFQIWGEERKDEALMRVFNLVSFKIFFHESFNEGHWC